MSLSPSLSLYLSFSLSLFLVLSHYEKRSLSDACDFLHHTRIHTHTTRRPQTQKAAATGHSCVRCRNEWYGQNFRRTPPPLMNGIPVLRKSSSLQLCLIDILSVEPCGFCCTCMASLRVCECVFMIQRHYKSQFSGMEKAFMMLYHTISSTSDIRVRCIASMATSQCVPFGARLYRYLNVVAESLDIMQFGK